MNHQLAVLVAANVTFVGGHFVLSHPLRALLVGLLGEKVFLAFYSLAQIAALGWVIVAFRAIPPGGQTLWNGQSTTMWIIASLVTLVSLVLFVGSFKGNPALPATNPGAISNAKPYGAFAVTRHPMMWGIALWAFAHVLVSPNARTTITAMSMAILALVGSFLQDRKKEDLLGQAWNGWESRTTFSPRWRQIGEAGLGTWVTAIVLWLLLTWAHSPLASIPAGIWRWIA